MLTITVDFRYKADSFLFLGDVYLRLKIMDSLGTTLLGEKKFGHQNAWTSNYLAVTVPISSLNSNTGEFTLIWDTYISALIWTTFSVGKRTVSIIATK
jgi:hypothetical protein